MFLTLCGDELFDFNFEETGQAKKGQEELRAVWLQAAQAGSLDSPPPPTLIEPRELSRNLATFDLAFGRGALRIDFDPPAPGARWIRWTRSLYVAEKPVYDVGLLCSTCEFFLGLVGWPAEDASATAQKLERSAESDDLILKLISPLRPGLIQSGDEGGFLYLVMPIRLNV